MRVFVAGASGAIGTRLVPQLIEAGHEVIGTAHVARKRGSRAGRSARSRSCSTCSTAEPCGRPCSRAEPDAIVHEATALCGRRILERTSTAASRQTNRLRTEGTDALLAAAREAGVRPLRRPELREHADTPARADR